MCMYNIVSYDREEEKGAYWESALCQSRVETNLGMSIVLISLSRVAAIRCDDLF